MKKIIPAIILAAAAMTPIPAVAVDFKAPILSIDGKPIPVSAEDKTPLTLGKIAQDALIAPTLPNDQPTPEEKGRRFWLAMKIHDGATALTAEEVALIKKVVGLAYGPLVVGRVSEMLDPASVPKK